MRRQRNVARVVPVVVIGACLLAMPALAQDCPELVGQWPYGEVWAAAVSGDYAYFGSGGALMVADVSEPSAPQVVGSVALPDILVEVAVSDGYAYVADWRAGLRIVDVQIPSAPVEVGPWGWGAPGHVARDVAVSGGYAYVAAGYDGVRVIDVSTPSASVEVGFFPTPGWASGVDVVGAYAYVAEIVDIYSSSGGTLRVIDVSVPSAPVEEGSVHTPGWARAVAVADG